MSSLPAVAARYFDGRSSRLHQVLLTVSDGQASISGDAQRSVALAVLRVSERSRHAARKVTYPDGAYLEISDLAAFDHLLEATGHRDGLVVRWQMSWRAAAGAALATVALLAAGYLYALPALANAVAAALPQAAVRHLGDGTLAALDLRAFAPTRLPEARQEALRTAFAVLAPPEPGTPPYTLVFRHSRVGPNAFALPSGDIVLTDQLVRLLDDDRAVLGVLAHELGHLQRRHMLRRILESSVVGAVSAALLGDVSTALAALPTLVLDMRYSRAAEREADDYAIAMLAHNGIPLDPLADGFARLAQKADDAPAWLSSHPASEERIARFRAARR
jgi:predicted Zn-dependent protease